MGISDILFNAAKEMKKERLAFENRSKDRENRSKDREKNIEELLKILSEKRGIITMKNKEE